METRNRASEAKASKDSTGSHGLTVTTVLLMLVGVFVSLYVVFYGEWFGRFRWEWYDSCISTPNIIATGFVVFLVVLIRPLLAFLGKRVKRSMLFSSADLSLVFNAISAGSQVAHVGFLTVVLVASSSMVLVRKSAIMDYFQQRSEWLVLKDSKMALNLLVGKGDVPWGTWIPILLVWGVFFAAVMFMYQCVAVIVNRSWHHHEHLTYPTVQPILTVTEGVEQGMPEILRNRLTWVGLALAVVYRGLPALHRFIPAVPNISHNVGDFLAPLQNIPFLKAMLLQTSILTLPLWPWALALMWLVVTSHVLFSIWFFALVRALYTATLDSYGLLGYRGLPFTESQSGWLFITLGVYYLWMMRRSLKEAVMISIGRMEQSKQDQELGMSIRTAVFGGVFAFMIVVVFAWYFFSLAPWLSIPILLFLVVADIALARFRAEGGIGYHGNIMAFPGPNMNFVIGGVATMLGSRIVSNRNFLGLGYFGLLANTLNPNVGSTLEALHMAERKNIRPKSMFKAIWIGIGTTIFLGFVIGWPMIYRNGGLRGFPVLWSYAEYYAGDRWWETISQMLSVHESAGFDFFRAGLLLIPCGLMVLLIFMNTRFVWWPFHPMGFGVATADFAWRWTMPAFVAWLLKSLTLRWGGFGMWKKFNPFFIGLFVGDFFVIVVQTVMAIMFKA